MLCPRKCRADRHAGKRGFCGQTDEIRLARAALHFWEEPCISGKNGSGAVFHRLYSAMYILSEQGDFHRRKRKGCKHGRTRPYFFKP